MFTNSERRTFKATLPYFPKDLKQEPARWKQVRDWLHSRGVIKQKMPLDKLFTTRFVSKPYAIRHTP